MKIPDWAMPVVLSACFALQAWTLSEIINLKVQVAAIAQQVLDVQTKQH
jgi:hypothetical protein